MGLTKDIERSGHMVSMKKQRIPTTDTYFISETNEDRIHTKWREEEQKPVKNEWFPRALFGFFLLTRRRLSDGSAPYISLVVWMAFFWPTSRRLSDGYENIRRLTDVCGHIYKKKYIFVIFCRFKRKNSRAVGSNRRILDRNVVVW